MTDKKGLLIIILLLFFALVFSYTGYRIYIPYKQIQTERKKYGVETPCKGLSEFPFKKGNWTGIPIDMNIIYTNGAHNMIPHDLDKDGEMELIANSYRSDALILYKYDGHPHEPVGWSRYVIDSSVGGGNPRPKNSAWKLIKSIVKEKLLGGFTSGAHYTAIADMNNDGRDDLVLAGDCKNYDIVWYETPNDITDTSKWVKHVVYSNDLHRTYHLETGDIDGDGDMDIVFAGKTDNSVGWLQNNGSSGNWPLTWIDNDCIRCFNSRVADIDKDGKDDIFASEDDSPNGGLMHLYRFVDDPKGKNNWINHRIAHFPPGEGVGVFEIIDIDMDGDLDVVTANHQGSIYILKNPYPKSVLEEWNRYKITESENSEHDFREIDVGDIDGDKDLDIIVADEGKNQVIWFENDGRTFYEGWKDHIVDKSDQYLRWCHSVELGDIDGDGDLDIAVAAAASNVFLWYSNEMIQK